MAKPVDVPVRLCPVRPPLHDTSLVGIFSQSTFLLERNSGRQRFLDNLSAVEKGGSKHGRGGTLSNKLQTNHSSSYARILRRRRAEGRSEYIHPRRVIVRSRAEPAGCSSTRAVWWVNFEPAISRAEPVSTQNARTGILDRQVIPPPKMCRFGGLSPATMPIFLPRP